MNTGTPKTLDWSDLDRRTVDVVRALAMDAVEEAGSGHPGTAMSLAPVAYLLFQKVMRHDPTDPKWIGRDRFVLSCGHSSLTLYIQLYLAGYGLSLNDIKRLRQWGSLTPGHPEYGHTAGVETTTGPLGQGIGNAVGMAMAARRERGLFDPDTPIGESPFDHYIYVLCSDGDVQEGISHEVSALAGTQKLGNLIVIWDDNRISIEDDTQIAFTEDVVARYAADEEARRRILDNRIYREISGTLAGSQEYMAMERLYELHEGGGYDLLVLDTPPSRNALDFLDAPRRLVPAMRDGLTSTNVFVHVEATRAGAGIGFLPCFMGDLHADLVRLLPDDVAELLPYWMVLRPDSMRRPAVAAVVQALREQTAAHREFLLGRGKTSSVAP